MCLTIVLCTLVLCGRYMDPKKIKFYTKTSVEKIEDGSVTLSNGEVLNPDFVLMATGRKPRKHEKI